MHIQTDRAFIPVGTLSVRYLQVVISAPPAPAAAAGAARSPVDIAVVLDRSGSMDGSKITMARKAVTHAVRLLKPDDHVAVVCYDDQVDTVLERTLASREAKALVMGRLAGIEPRGSTNLSGGWLAGAHELQPAHDAGPAAGTGALPAARVKRVLLLTDGLANAGAVDPQALAATAARLRTEGVTTSTFGIGADFDEELLSRLATQGGGHFYYIEKAGQIPDFFTSELGETLDIVARDARFEITCKHGVSVALLTDVPAEQVAGSVRVRLGDLVADQQVTLTLAVRVQDPPALGSGIEVRCRLTDRDHVLFAEPMYVDWAVVAAADNQAQPVNQAVLRAAADAMAVAAQAEALQANRRGAFDEAQRIVAQGMAAVRALAPDDTVVREIVARLDGDRNEFAAAMSPQELKRRHFMTYNVSGSRDAEGKARRKHKAPSAV